MSDDQDQLQIVENSFGTPSSSRISVKKDGKVICAGEQVVYIQGAAPNESGLVQVLAEENGVQQLLTLDLYNFTLVNNGADQAYKLLAVEPNEGSSSNVESAIAASIIQADNEKASSDNDQEVKLPAQNVSKTILSFLARAREDLKASKESATSDDAQKSVANKARKRPAHQLPPAHELLASPNFKLYIFNCKFCEFKCNALKELTAHKKVCQAVQTHSKKSQSQPRPTSTITCAYCPFKAATKMQLARHQQDKHSDNEEEAEDSSVMYVCSSCGLEADNESAIAFHTCKGPKMPRR